MTGHDSLSLQNLRGILRKFILSTKKKNSEKLANVGIDLICLGIIDWFFTFLLLFLLGIKVITLLSPFFFFTLLGLGLILSGGVCIGLLILLDPDS